MKELPVKPDTVAKPHEYCIDWSEDELSWSVDGVKSRTVKRTDSWNATAGRFDFPQTPSRVMLSLWPAGLPSNGKGTVEWAGGEIDWNSKYMTNGMYAALVTQVTVDCYDPPDNIKKSGSKSYKYTNMNPTNNTVEMSNDIVILGSLMDTGDNPGSSGSSSSKTSSGPKPTKSVNMVPGGNPGGGARQDTPVGSTVANQPSGAPNAQPTEGGSDGGAGSGGGPGSGSGSNTFQQGGNSSGSNAGAALEPSFGKISGSTLAIVFALLGLLIL